MKRIIVLVISLFSERLLFSQGNLVLTDYNGYDILNSENLNLVKKFVFPGTSFSLAIDYTNNLVYSIHDGIFISATNLITGEKNELPVDNLGKQKLQYNAKNNRLYYLVDRVVYEYDLKTFQSYPCTNHRMTNYKYFAGDSLILYVDADTLFAYSIFNKSNELFYLSPANVQDVIIDNARQKIYFTYFDIFHFINLVELDPHNFTTSTISIESTEFQYIDEANGFLYYYVTELNEIKRLNLVTKKVEAITDDLLPIFKKSIFLKGFHDGEILISNSASCDYLTSLSILAGKYSQLLSTTYQNLNFQKLDPYRSIYWLTMKFDSTFILYRSKIDLYNPEEIMRFPVRQSPSDITFISENELVLTIPSSREIIRYNVSNKIQELIYENPDINSKMTHVSIDPASDYIFWWDYNSKNLYRMHFDATDLRILQQNILDGNFCINPIDKILYWSNGGKFYKSDYDGHKVLIIDNSNTSRKGDYSNYSHGYFDEKTRSYFVLHFYGNDFSDNTALLEMKTQDTIPAIIKIWHYAIYNNVAFYEEISTSTKAVEPDYFNMYPNPFKNELNIQYAFDPKNKILLSVKNILGQNVYQKSISTYTDNFKIDLSMLKSGNYIVQLIGKNMSSSRKVQKLD